MRRTPRCCCMSRAAAMVDEWIVLFGKARGPATIWTRLLSRPWQHCFALGHEARGGGWVEVNPAFNMVRMNVLRREDVERWLSAAAHLRWTMLRIAQRDAGPHRPRLGLLTCAGLLAHIIGLRETVWTPRGLHRHLIRAGAVPVDGG